MARPREPIKLIQAKGKKHLSKEEIEKRSSQEIKVDLTKVKAPSYLEKKQKLEFNKISKKLLSIGIITELDEDCLARYILSKDLYIKYTERLTSLVNRNDDEDIDKINKMQNIQDKAFKQCQSSSRDLGLTISSRCKLVIPNQNSEDDDDDL